MELSNREMIRKYGIVYCTTNLVNGRKYIGQLKTIDRSQYHIDNYLGSGKAMKAAIKKYGKENFTRQILCECPTAKLLTEMEKYYIDYYCAIESDLFYNLYSPGNYNNNERRIKEVMQYDMKGHLIKKWKSAGKAGQELGISPLSIRRCCRGVCNEYKKYQWRYAEDESRDKIEPVCYARVLQYDLDGKFIKNWDSMSEAAEHLNIRVSGISHCATGPRNMYKGYIWKVYEKDFPLEVEPYIDKKEIPIKQSLPDGTVVKYYRSIKTAERELKLGKNMLGPCLKSERCEYKGFIWSVIEK